MFKINKQKSKPETNSIMIGMSFNGDLEIDGDIRIDGSVTGAVRANGKIVIGESGKVEGDLGCENASVSGIIEGTLVIEDLLVLKNSARVHGDIYSERIECEEGAEINGTLNIGMSWKNEIENEQKESIQSEGKTEGGSKGADFIESPKYPEFED